MKLLIITRIRVMAKKIINTYVIESHGIDLLQEYIDEFIKYKKIVSVSITETMGPQHFLALIVYKEN